MSLLSKGGPGSGIKGHRTYHPDKPKESSQSLSEEERKARRRERAKKRREAKKAQPEAKPEPKQKPEPKKYSEEERKARRRERAKKRREAKKSQEGKQPIASVEGVKSNPFKGVSSTQAESIARRVAGDSYNKFLSYGKGQETLSHFKNQYGEKALDHFFNHTVVTFGELPEGILGQCRYLKDTQVIGIQEEWENRFGEIRDTTIHEMTHSLYSEVSSFKSWAGYGGVSTYYPNNEVTEGIAVLGVNMSSWAPHCNSYMQYACKTHAALVIFAREENTTPKKLYKSLSNISDLPLKKRKELRMRLDYIYQKMDLKNYDPSRIVKILEMWRNQDD